MRTDVALEILGDPQSYSFETVRSAGQHVIHLIASQSPIQSVDHAIRKIRELEAENARLKAEVERLEKAIDTIRPWS